MKKTFAAVFAFLLFVSVAVAPASAAAPNPSLAGIPGTWAPGATPPNLDPNRPVLLFVQGLTGSAASWYGSNDMYQTAYNNGYQTAFVELYDSAGTSKNMWDNGKLLAQKITEISQTYHKKIVIVAHSKGGVDTQAALVHYNAYPYVSNVITLSSPHHGSELADLAYSNWAGWLADLIGYKNDGTYSMQTSYMNYFRSITDSNPNAAKNKFYTFAGNNWSTSSASYFAGGLYLSLFGPNDGVVTVSSASVPKGTMVRVGSWDHNTIRQGSSTFSLFKSYLIAGAPLVAAAFNNNGLASIDPQASNNGSLAAFGPQASNPVPETAEGGLLVKGGQHSGTATEHFQVENNVRSLKLDWIADQPAERLKWISPDGKEKQVNVTVAQDGEVLKNGWHHMAEIDKPEQGEWTLQAESKQQGAYMLTVRFDSDLSKSLKLQVSKDKHKIRVESDASLLPKAKQEIRYNMQFTREHGNPAKRESQKLKRQVPVEAGTDLDIPDVSEPGVYQAAFTVHGETAQGVPYERSFIRSVYFDEQGARH